MSIKIFKNINDLRVLIFLLLSIIYVNGYTQNCPDYSNTAIGSGIACGGQNYSMTVENTACNGQIFIDVVGNYGSWGNEITWEIVSSQSGAVVGSGGPGISNANINITIGPLDPSVHGNIYDLIVYDSWGDGFSGGGFIQTEQGGIVLANTNGDFGSYSHVLFNANITISSATITINTPSGPVVSTVENCNDFFTSFLLNNTNFCNTINVNLPWSITCDVSGATLASGTHNVTVYPQVPSSADDIVDISWNTNTCSWDISPQNDCDALDIGNVFDISPDPNGLNTNACSNGNQNFTIDYTGLPGSPNCCSTAGSLTPITYNETLNSNDAVAQNSPYGGSNNSALINFPPNNSGGNATSLDLCFDMTGFCFNPPSTGTDQSFFVFIFVDGNQVLQAGPLYGNSYSTCIDLTDIPGGYNQSSDIEIYMLPNTFSFNGVNTTFSPSGNCSSDGFWTANFNATLDVTFDQMIGLPVSCSYDIVEPHTCCSNTNLTASDPPPINIQCVGDVPLPNVNVVNDESSDCSSAPTVTFDSDVSDGLTCPETITRTYEVEDQCGNTIQVEQLIIINDNTNPTASNPAPINVQCIGDVPAADITVVTDEADNCTANPTVAFVSDVSDGLSCPETITRTYSVTDDCNNSINVTQTITVGDNTNPTASNPAPIAVQCIGDVPAPDITVVTDEADNCTANPTVAFVSDVSDGLSCPETITRTYSVTDDCNNSINVTQTITVGDNTNPTASNPAPINVQCIGDVPAADITVVTDEADNCTANPTVAFVSDVSDGLSCPETITRTYSVTDDCNNSINVTQTIIVGDNTNPTASNPAPISTSGAAPAPDITVVTDEADNCTVNPVVAFVSDVSDNNTCPETITRTYSVTDDCNNSINVTQTITIGDAINPTASNPADINVQCIGDVPAPDVTVVTDEADNGATPTVTFEDDNSDGLSCPETISRRYRVTDDCGNFIFVTQSIIVNDNTNPTASNPAPINVQCIGDVPVADITVVTDEADNCTANPIVAFVSDVSDGLSCPETITRTYSVTDDCNNSINVTQTITVDDNTNPTASNPAPITVQCIGDVPAADITVVTDEADNCTANPTVAFVSDVSDGLSCPEMITRTYSVTDDCNNSINVTQTITVGDNTNPTASNPAPISASGTAPAPDVTVVTDEADNCTANPTVAFVSDVSDGNTCPETITRTYSVTDDCNNSINVTQTITLGDAISPTASNPADINVQCIADVPAPDVTVVTDEADNGAAPTVTFEDDNSDGLSCPETISRRYRVTDDCGNFIFVTQSIIVNDNTNPTASNPAPIAVQCIGDVPAPDITVVTDEADNCTVNPTVAFVSDVSDGLSCPETITRTYSVTDDCNNSINVTQTITVGDNTNPTASNPAPINTSGAAPAPDITVVTDEADNCTANPTVAFVSDVSDNNTCPETITRTYSVTDDCNNSINVTQTITIGDAINPTASNPAPINVQCIGDVPAPDVTVVTDEADNGAAPTVTFEDDNSDGLTCPETITRRYRVTDDCGNFIFVTQSIIVNDNTNPTASNPAPIAVQCIGDVPAPDITVVTDEADNCTVNPTVAFVSDVSDGLSCPETITRTYSVTDDCNNSINVTQTITVGDNTNPSASNPAPTVVQCIGDVPAVDITVVNDEADNCTANPTVAFVSGVSDNNTCNGEVITRTYSVTDDCNNSINVTHTITIDSFTPNFNLSNTDPTTCSGIDGTITISGLSPITDFTFSYNGGTSSTITSDATGNYVINGLSAGTYTGFTVSDVDCPACSTTDNSSITLSDPNAPVVDAGIDQTICLNDQATLTANNPDGAIIAWDNGVVDATPFSPAVGTVTYTVTATLNGCVSTDQVDVTVNPLPSIDAGIDIDICDGDQTSLTANNPDGAVINWDNGVVDGTPFNPIATNTYTVTADLNGCINTDQVDINVNPVPVFNLNYTDPSTCGGDEGTITISGLDPNTNYDVSYESSGNPVGPNTISSDANGDIIISTLTAGSYNDFLVSYTASGCSTFDASSFNLVDPNAPTIDAGIDQTICENTITQVVANNPDGANISWSGGVNDATDFTPLAGVNTYTVTADLNGCTASDQVVIIVNQLPPVVVNASDLTICLGDDVTLYGAGAVNYTWDNGVIDNTPFVPSATNTYTVTGEDANGCVRTDVITINVNPIPTVDFSAPETKGCAPLTVDFSAITSPNISSFEWNFGDGANATLNTNNTQHQYNSTGCYDVTLTVTDNAGCTNNTTIFDFVCIDKRPYADFSQNFQSVSEPNTEVQFSNHSLGAAYYNWIFYEGPTSVEANPSHEFPFEPDTYEVLLVAISQNGCRDSATSIVVVEEDLIFYVPNTFTPDGNDFNDIFKPIMTSGYDPFKFSMLIFNRWGEPVFETHNTDIGWDGTYQGEIVQDGVYVWKIIIHDPKNDERKEFTGHVNVLK